MKYNYLAAVAAAIAFASYFLPWIGGPFNVSPNAIIDLHSGMITFTAFLFLLSYGLFVLVVVLAPLGKLSPKVIIAAGVTPFVVAIAAAFQIEIVPEGMSSLRIVTDAVGRGLGLGLGMVIYFLGSAAIVHSGFTMLRGSIDRSTKASNLAN
jgi:hypothetical protein